MSELFEQSAGGLAGEAMSYLAREGMDYLSDEAIDVLSSVWNQERVAELLGEMAEVPSEWAQEIDDFVKEGWVRIIAKVAELTNPDQNSTNPLDMNADAQLGPEDIQRLSDELEGMRKEEIDAVKTVVEGEIITHARARASIKFFIRKYKEFKGADLEIKPEKETYLRGYLRKAITSQWLPKKEPDDPVFNGKPEEYEKYDKARTAINELGQSMMNVILKYGKEPGDKDIKVLEALLRLYDSTHRSGWEFVGEGLEGVSQIAVGMFSDKEFADDAGGRFDPDDLNTERKFEDSDAYILATFAADVIINIRGNYKTNGGTEADYTAGLQSIEDALIYNKVGFGVDDSVIGPFAEFFMLSGLDLASSDKTPLERNIDLTARYLENGTMIREEMVPEVVAEREEEREGLLGAIDNIKNTLAGLGAAVKEKIEAAQQAMTMGREAALTEACKNQDVAYFFEHLFEGGELLDPEEKKREFAALKGKLGIDEGFDTSVDSIFGLLDAAKGLKDHPLENWNEIGDILEAIKKDKDKAVFNLAILGMTEEKIGEMVQHYIDQRNRIEVGLNAQGIARKSWGDDVSEDDIRSSVQNWARNNLEKKFDVAYWLEPLDEFMATTPLAMEMFFNAAEGNLKHMPKIGWGMYLFNVGAQGVELYGNGDNIEGWDQWKVNGAFVVESFSDLINMKYMMRLAGDKQMMSPGSWILRHTVEHAVGDAAEGTLRRSAYEWSRKRASFGFWNVIMSGKIIAEDIIFDYEYDPRLGRWTTRFNDSRQEALFRDQHGDIDMEDVNAAVNVFLMWLFGMAPGIARMPGRWLKGGADTTRVAKPYYDFDLGRKGLRVNSDGTLTADKELAGLRGDKALSKHNIEFINIEGNGKKGGRIVIGEQLAVEGGGNVTHIMEMRVKMSSTAMPGKPLWDVTYDHMFFDRSGNPVYADQEVSGLKYGTYQTNQDPFTQVTNLRAKVTECKAATVNPTSTFVEPLESEIPKEYKGKLVLKRTVRLGRTLYTLTGSGARPSSTTIEIRDNGNGRFTTTLKENGILVSEVTTEGYPELAGRLNTAPETVDLTFDEFRITSGRGEYTENLGKVPRRLRGIVPSGTLRGGTGIRLTDPAQNLRNFMVEIRAGNVTPTATPVGPVAPPTVSPSGGGGGTSGSTTGGSASASAGPTTAPGTPTPGSTTAPDTINSADAGSVLEGLERAEAAIDAKDAELKTLQDEAKAKGLTGEAKEIDGIRKAIKKPKGAKGHLTAARTALEADGSSANTARGAAQYHDVMDSLADADPRMQRASQIRKMAELIPDRVQVSTPTVEHTHNFHDKSGKARFVTYRVTLLDNNGALIQVLESTASNVTVQTEPTLVNNISDQAAANTYLENRANTTPGAGGGPGRRGTASPRSMLEPSETTGGRVTETAGGRMDVAADGTAVMRPGPEIASFEETFDVMMKEDWPRVKEALREAWKRTLGRDITEAPQIQRMFRAMDSSGSGIKNLLRRALEISRKEIRVLPPIQTPETPGHIKAMGVIGKLGTGLDFLFKTLYTAGIMLAWYEGSQGSQGAELNQASLRMTGALTVGMAEGLAGGYMLAAFMPHPVLKAAAILIGGLGIGFVGAHHGIEFARWLQENNSDLAHTFGAMSQVFATGGSLGDVVSDSWSNSNGNFVAVAGREMLDMDIIGGYEQVALRPSEGHWSNTVMPSRGWKVTDALSLDPSVPDFQRPVISVFRERLNEQIESDEKDILSQLRHDISSAQTEHDRYYRKWVASNPENEDARDSDLGATYRHYKHRVEELRAEKTAVERIMSEQNLKLIYDVRSRQFKLQMELEKTIDEDKRNELEGQIATLDQEMLDLHKKYFAPPFINLEAVRPELLASARLAADMRMERFALNDAVNGIIDGNKPRTEHTLWQERYEERIRTLEYSDSGAVAFLTSSIRAAKFPERVEDIARRADEFLPVNPDGTIPMESLMTMLVVSEGLSALDSARANYTALKTELADTRESALDDLKIKMLDAEDEFDTQAEKYEEQIYEQIDEYESRDIEGKIKRYKDLMADKTLTPTKEQRTEWQEKLAELKGEAERLEELKGAINGDLYDPYSQFAENLPSLRKYALKVRETTEAYEDAQDDTPTVEEFMGKIAEREEYFEMHKHEYDVQDVDHFPGDAYPKDLQFSYTETGMYMVAQKMRTAETEIENVMMALSSALSGYVGDETFWNGDGDQQRERYILAEAAQRRQNENFDVSQGLMFEEDVLNVDFGMRSFERDYNGIANIPGKHYADMAFASVANPELRSQLTQAFEGHVALNELAFREISVLTQYGVFQDPDQWKEKEERPSEDELVRAFEDALVDARTEENPQN